MKEPKALPPLHLILALYFVLGFALMSVIFGLQLAGIIPWSNGR